MPPVWWVQEGVAMVTVVEVVIGVGKKQQMLACVQCTKQGVLIQQGFMLW
jgi:hypothetical protein